jgi:acetolactate decarboxylase
MEKNLSLCPLPCDRKGIRERMKKIVPLIVLVLFASVPFVGCGPDIKTDRDTLFQTSTISALMKGVFDGTTTVGELKNYGDFGIGTFEALDGEMLVLDGQCYRAQLDGTTVVVQDNTITPFAAITYFDNDQVINNDSKMDINQLQSYVDTLLASQNYFYAVKIEGKFSYVKTRSVPIQYKPYPSLTDAVKNQQVTELSGIEGTMLGFRCPPYVDGVNVPGYHFHFINKDRKKGGHVLDCSTTDVVITIDHTPSFVMILPDTQGFSQVNLGKCEPEGLKQVEQGK